LVFAEALLQNDRCASFALQPASYHLSEMPQMTIMTNETTLRNGSLVLIGHFEQPGLETAKLYKEMLDQANIPGAIGEIQTQKCENGMAPVNAPIETT
jgi:hypothetical protein